MALELDHTIISVKDLEETVDFYVKLLGLRSEGRHGPFAVVRISDSLTLDFEAAEEFEHQHFAFAMDAEEFDKTFQRIKEAGLPYGDGPFTSNNMEGPGRTQGARGMGKAVYFHDPSGHLLEIKTY